MAKGETYLFLGPEIGERRDAVDTIRKNLTKKSNQVPEEYSFYAGETSISEMVAILRNGSLFADARLFQIKHPELIKKKEDQELLASYMQSPQDDTILILVSDETSLDKKIENAVPKENKRIFWELFENRKADWISAFFRREGYHIEEDGIEAILELVENNTDALGRECSKLMLFIAKGEPIREADVSKWLSHTREESAFTLFSRIAEGNLEKSAEILQTLLAAKESSIAILAGLNWCFHKLRDYSALAAQGINDEFEFKKIGLASQRVRKDYIAANKFFSPQAIDRSIALIADFDILVRSNGTAFESILMDYFLYKIIACRGTRREKVCYFDDTRV
jgi:DNA polymerase-3 subunit delta